MYVVSAHTEVQLLVGQILMDFASCEESRATLLEHDGLLDSLVEGVKAKQTREDVKSYALKALLEIRREDKEAILRRVSSLHTISTHSNENFCLSSLVRLLRL